MATFIQDVRYGLRTLAKNPGFTAVALLTLALGIGANTAIFSVVNGVLLQPLPYPGAKRLVMTYESDGNSLAYPNFLDWRRENHCFTDIAASLRHDFILTGSGQPERLNAQQVSASFFPVLGVDPLVGRGFLPEEDRLGAGGVVMLSYGLWQRRFGASPDILGKSLTLNARNYTVIGILPRDFRFRDEVELYVPLGQGDDPQLRDRHIHMGMIGMARLKPGVTIGAAEAEMNSIARQLAKLYPDSNTGHGVRLVPMKEDIVSEGRTTLLLLVGAVGFVLIIACANVANLLLAQSMGRRREFGIRVALGATRERVIRQLLTQSVLLAAGAGALGLLFALWGTQLLLAAFPDVVPRTQAVAIDPYVLLFTLAVAILTGVLFGLAPAFHSSSVHPQESLKEGSRGSGGGRHRTEGIFVVLEVGLAVVLLAGAGLMIQSLWRLWQIDPGFDTHHLLTARVGVSPTVMANGLSIHIAYQQMLERVASAPGVQAAALTTQVPLGGHSSEIGMWLGRRPQPPEDEMFSVLFYVTTPEYLHVMGIPLREGRFLNERDTTPSPLVVVIDEAMAKHLFPGEDPLGKEINIMLLGPVQIVGVVGHVKHWGLDSDDAAHTRDEMYFPFLQIPDKIMPGIGVGAILVARTVADPASAVSAVRTQVAGPTNDQPMYAVESLEQMISLSLAERRFTMLLLVIFACTALALASVGIYGVMSYSVTRRTHEFGVRMALGASRRAILWLVVGDGMALAGAGTVVGLTAAFGLTRLLASLLYGVRPTDPATLVAVSLLLGGIALLACYIPAWRATKVDPLVALRCE
jgi:predicted permease